ncbi:MAG TPA: UDP-N-acetylglucosamine 2-epimerase [Nocardioidaceae bacterium]|nr:UDP-N-acetylglucosamine 2-epimerase [Nocardioidaceae bacterium]
MTAEAVGDALLRRLTDSATSSGSPFVHVITIATKPDIIKQAPVYLELRRRGEQAVLCHTGQHHDHRYSGGMLDEFGIEPDIHLGITGSLAEKTAQIVERFGAVLEGLRGAGLTPIPYIHGDTATSMAVGVASYVSRVACVHVEAGIRTLTPRAEVYARFLDDFHAGRFDWDEYAKAMRDPATFERGSREPFPEQFNTRVSDAATGFHAAPVELDREFLIAEGFPPDTIEVVGNSVVDAMTSARADAERAEIFTRYPQLKGGGFIRVCIHRRENTEDETRFRALFGAIESLLRRGRRVLLISLFGTEAAIDAFGLRARLDELVRDYPDDFIYSDVWPYYRDVIAAMLECSAVATDSGSMQEEMNVLGIPCVTLRYGTDRAETVLAGANVLAPPIDSELVADIIEGALAHPELGDVAGLYGERVSERLVDEVLARLVPGDGLFRDEAARLGLGVRET